MCNRVLVCVFVFIRCLCQCWELDRAAVTSRFQQLAPACERILCSASATMDSASPLCSLVCRLVWALTAEPPPEDLCCPLREEQVRSEKMEGQVSFSICLPDFSQHGAVRFARSHWRPVRGTQCMFWCYDKQSVVVLEVGLGLRNTFQWVWTDSGTRRDVWCRSVAKYMKQRHFAVSFRSCCLFCSGGSTKSWSGLSPSRVLIRSWSHFMPSWLQNYSHILCYCVITLFSRNRWVIV